jgi:hypothetical protein
LNARPADYKSAAEAIPVCSQMLMLHLGDITDIIATKPLGHGLHVTLEHIIEFS